MSKDNVSSAIAKALLIWVLIFATLGFGLVGLCGAVFTVTSLPDVLVSLFNGRLDIFATKRAAGGGVQWGAGAFLKISVPSLLIGGAVAWWCGRKLWKWFNA